MHMLHVIPKLSQSGSSYVSDLVPIALLTAGPGDTAPVPANLGCALCVVHVLDQLEWVTHVVQSQTSRVEARGTGPGMLGGGARGVSPF